MPGPDVERFAGLVADNVVSAIERAIGERLTPEARRDHAVADLMREILATMPTASGAVIASACNRVLSTVPDGGLSLPRVIAVDMGDGAVTMSPSVL